MLVPLVGAIGALLTDVDAGRRRLSPGFLNHDYCLKIVWIFPRHTEAGEILDSGKRDMDKEIPPIHQTRGFI